MKWGLADIEDGLWIGNDDGPLTYDDELLARAAATIVTVQMGWRFGRVQATEFKSAGPKRDELPTKMGVLDAIRLAEGGSDEDERS